MTDYGLGRLPAIDPRDQSFPMRLHLGALAERRTKYWPFFHPALDQGQTSSCVGHAWKGWMLAAPTIQTRPTAEPTAITLYREATHRDEWAGNEDDMDSGTSIRAGAKACQDRGLLGEYTWAWDVDTVADWLSAKGPVVIGVAFYDSMFDLSIAGHMQIAPNARVVGGHAMLLLGWDQRRGRARGINSWGSWGQRGRFWLDGETLMRLFRDDGEAATAVEVRP